ncbi:MAG: hypothetical protein II088_02195 [Bacteroidales bacterium]|nr:hypothetical protein [Bacteroidales bacterium]
MSLNPQHIALLRQLVSESAGHSIKTSTDFIFLSGEIQGRLKETISTSTLKRIWGYIDGYASVRNATLDVLARFTGFPDWETFVTDYCETESVQSSHRVVAKSLYSTELGADDKVEIRWNPNRRLKLCYKGDNRFDVTESENAKLKVGDSFLCERFTLNEPLYVEHILDDGTKELFVIGNKGGLTSVGKA